jgi:3D (Asp-Asp-Asp) domain-containing protein
MQGTLRLTLAMATAIAFHANGGAALAETVVSKHPLATLNAPACQQIEANAENFDTEEVSRTTRYFTPIFQPGPEGELRKADRRHCLKIQGSCVVGDYLYNAGGGPSGTRYERAAVRFIFGQGSGTSEYNRTNALFPCRTVAADLKQYKLGTVLFIPALKGRICPQTGRPMDGCFVVGDKGGAIKGQGRFDMFGGECAKFDGARYECRDAKSTTLEVPAGTEFYVVPRDHKFARGLRDQVDAFVENGWKPVNNAKTAEYPGTRPARHARACGRARRSDAASETPCRD